MTGALGILVIGLLPFIAIPVPDSLSKTWRSVSPLLPTQFSEGPLGARTTLSDRTGFKKRIERTQEVFLPGLQTVAQQTSQKKQERGIVVTPSLGTQATNQSKRWAVVIGINGYTHVPPLNYALKDAQAVAEKLESLGFDKVIRIENEAATKGGIERALNALKTQVGPHDSVLIFYAGHGQTETLADGSQMGYWVPVDGDVNNYIATAISMDTLRLLSQAIPARYVLYVIDACYSGLALRQTWHSDGQTLVRQIITAGRGGEEVLEQDGHGVFTRQLLHALNGRADGNGDGTITASELGVFLQSEVPIQSSGRQHPVFGRWAGEEEFIFPVPEGGPPHAPSSPTPVAAQSQNRSRQQLRVMVMIPEVLDGKPVTHPSSEAAVIGKLLDSGFQVIDQGQINEIRSPNQVRTFLATRNSGPAQKMARDYASDVLILGEGVGERAGNIMGTSLISSQARIQVKIMLTTNGQILASRTIEAAGVALAPTLAGKKALQKAGEQLAEVVIKDLNALKKN